MNQTILARKPNVKSVQTDGHIGGRRDGENVIKEYTCNYAK